MNITGKKSIYLKILFIFILLVLPFSVSNFSDDVTAQKITSDLAFYEINTCSISLFEFLVENPNVIYQDHYKIKFNDYSSARCFGQITGIDQIGYVFYISIGTNIFFNLAIQSSVWLLIISMIPKNKNIELKIKSFISILATALLLCIGIYSEQRFYTSKFYLLDLIYYETYFYIFCYFFAIAFVFKIVFESRQNNIVYLLPFLYITMGLYTGYNLYFLSIIFLVNGIEEVISNKKYFKYLGYLNFLVFFWCFNAIGKGFYLNPDKVRGLVSSDYNFLSVFYWSYFFIFITLGIKKLVSSQRKKFDILKFKDNFLITGSLIVLIGYLSSSMPAVNFFTTYFFGLTKPGTTNQNLFEINFWGERVAWRGLFPSAETIGEFFGLSILIFVLYCFKEKKYKLTDVFMFFLSLVGLYASDNKAATFAVLFCIVLKVNKNLRVHLLLKISMFLFAIGVLIYFIRFENILFSLDFSSKNMLNLANAYSLDYNISSSLNFLTNLNENSIVTFFILAIGQFAFLINRSELWGIFIARYNPNFFEFLFGTGPFALSDHYGDIDIISKRLSTGTDLGFLLPHSSVLLVFLFFGIFGFLFFIFYYLKKLFFVKQLNYDNFLVILFIFLNILKSDSILYFPTLLLYGTLYYSIVKKK